jgi:hypothetical protein
VACPSAFFQRPAVRLKLPLSLSLLALALLTSTITMPLVTVWICTAARTLHASRRLHEVEAGERREAGSLPTHYPLSLLLLPTPVSTVPVGGSRLARMRACVPSLRAPLSSPLAALLATGASFELGLGLGWAGLICSWRRTPRSWRTRRARPGRRGGPATGRTPTCFRRRGSAPVGPGWARAGMGRARVVLAAAAAASVMLGRNQGISKGTENQIAQ